LPSPLIAYHCPARVLSGLRPTIFGIESYHTKETIIDEWTKTAVLHQDRTMPNPSVKRRYSKEEFAERGDTIYESDVRPHLKPDDDGKFAAIDIETGNYEIHEDELAVCDKLRARVPDAQIWMIRVGSRYVHRYGGREQRTAQ
jgi:hypothetical protein